MTAPDTSLKPGTYHLADGSTLTVRSDGSRVVVHPDGKRLVLGPDGTVVDSGEPKKTTDKSGRDTGITTTGKTKTENRWDQQAANSPAGLVAQAQQVADQAEAVAQYNATHPPVWVNGQQLVATSLNPDGTPKTLAYVGVRDTKGNVSSAASQLGGSNQPSLAVDPRTGNAITSGNTAFDALTVGATYGPLAGVKGDEQFTMATGPTNVMTGMPVSDSSFSSKLGDHGSEANTVANGTSKMTIAEGVQWLANLSSQNPQAYTQLVNELKHAGYTGQNGMADMIGGAYSEQVGLAFVKAAKDLSVMQQSTGSSMGLDDFLAAKTQAVKDAAGAAYQPVARDYADNGTLQAAAKSAAEEAIGRNLTAQELATFEASFRNQQTGYFNQYDAAKKAQAEAAATGQSAPGPNGVQPDSSGQASALVQGPGFQQDRANYQVQQYTQALAQLFGVK
jgi:hypothetical protein